MRRVLIAFIICFLSKFIFADIVDWTLVTIENESITYSEWKSAFKDTISQAEIIKKLGSKVPSAMDVLNKLIDNLILSIEAQKKQIDVGEEEILDRIDKIKKINNMNDEMFKTALREQGMSIDDLKKQIYNQLQAEKLQQMEIFPKIKRPSEEKLKEYYEKNKDKMIYQERRRVSHILFIPQENSSLTEQVKFKKLMEKVLEEAKKGKDFAQLAREYSQDEASKEKGGDIGWVEKGFYAPEFEKVVFSLKKDSISDVFPTRWGFHIVKVTDIKPSAPKSFQDAREDIASFLLQQAVEEEMKKWVDSKKNSYGIRIIWKDGNYFYYENNYWFDREGKKIEENYLDNLLSTDIF